MKIVRHLALLMIVCSVSLSTYAQKDFTADANAAFKGESYYSAIDMYKKAYAKEKNRPKKIDIIYKIAECYRMIEDPVQAEVWYLKAIKAKHPDVEAQFYLAEVIKKQGRYDEAIVEYNKYLAKNPNDVRATRGIKSCQQGQSWKDNPTRYEIENVKLINSREYDFSPVFADNKKFDEIILTSSRSGSTGNALDSRSGESFSDLYYTALDRKGKWSQPKGLEGGINTEHNEGTATLDKRGSTIYFTYCEEGKNQVFGCWIKTARKQGKAWAEATKVDFGIHDTSVIAHPTLGMNDQVMVVVSDKPGGFGGKDLYYSEYDKREKKWSELTNCGSDVNTNGDEMFPYLHANGDLYFASNGHAGMGGLDIFKAAKKTKTSWGSVENLRAPINSSSDDFGIIFEGNRDRGYFNSNRSGGRGGDDIYRFRMPPKLFAIQGTVKDVETGQVIQGATIKLLGTDGSSVEVKADQLGFYIFAEKEGNERYVQENTSYTILVTAENYLNSKGQETTVGVAKSTVFVHDFALQCANCGEINFSKVLYPLDKAELLVNSTVNSQDSLQELYQILVDNPNIVIQLAAHTDSRGDLDYNQNLSQRRAQTCVDFLISKGIAADRLEAKGFGEENPYKGTFMGKEVELTEEYINSLPKDQQELAHQANRRTVFEILRDDYVPTNQNSGGVEGDN